MKGFLIMEKFVNTLNGNKNVNVNCEYKIGKTYQFYIESEEKTADGRGYFNLFDKKTLSSHVYYFNDSRACFKSAMRSLLSSSPQLILTKSGVIPAETSSSSVIWRCVALAGCKQQLLASAT